MKNTEKQCYGIDLLKSLAMLFVVILHILGSGGILYTAVPFSANFYVGWFMEIGAFCAVNCFALATGFLMADRKIKYRKIAKLWLVVAFYNVAFLLIDIFLLKSPVTAENLSMLFPALSGRTWYFTAYFGLFFLMPFLNKLIEALEEKSYKILLLTGFLLFSVSSVITPAPVDTFNLIQGYSLWWLIYLYLLGAGMKKYNLFQSLGKGRCALGFLSMTVLTLIIKCGIIKAAQLQWGMVSYIADLYTSDRLICYNSPTVLLSSVFLTVFCMKLNIPKLMGKALTAIRPHIFQVYIIHVNYVIWFKFIAGKFVHYASEPAYIMAVYVILTALGIFAICLMIDFVRSLIFRLIRVDKGVDIISDKVIFAYSKISSKGKNCLKE